MSAIRNSGKLTLWGIEVFLATAEEGAISTAAKRLGVSISAVSQQLTSLEAALGVEVLDRSARPFGLTPAGRLFLQRAQAILNEAELARAELAQQDMGNLQRLRLGVIEDFDTQVSPNLLLDLAARFSRSRLQLETGPSHRLLDKLETRALDIVIASDPDQLPDWMERHPIVQDPFVKVRPKAGPMPEHLIAYTTRHLMGQQIERHRAARGLPATGRFELDSYAAILALVAEGHGWTILTPLGLASARRFLPQLDIGPLDAAPMHRTVSVMARKGVLVDMPREVAQAARKRVGDAIVAPLLERWPLLDGMLKLL